MCRELDCKPETLNKYLEKMNIKYDGNMSGKGLQKTKKSMSLIEYLNNS